MEEGEVSSRSQTRRTPLVLAAYLVLFLAAFIGLAPLFQIVAPLHAAGLDARAKTEILSRAMVWGAVTAAVANIAMGAISDSGSLTGTCAAWRIAASPLPFSTS